MNRALLFVALLAFALTSCDSPAPKIIATPVLPTTDVTAQVATAAVPTAKATETNISINPGYESVKKIFDTRGISYSISHGKIFIDNSDTQEKEKILLSAESGKIIETNDGIAKEIITANDESGNRYLYVDGHGWVKDVDISNSSFDNPITIPESWIKINDKKHTALNTLTALHYQDNPTIPQDAPDPKEWISVNYYGGPVLFLDFKPLNSVQVDPDYDPEEAMKSFDYSGVYEVNLSNGGKISIIGQTRNNPSSENENQLINLFAAFDGQTVDAINEQQGDHSVLKEIFESKKKDLVFVFSPPNNFDWPGSNLSFANQPQNPHVVNLNKQGEIFALLNNTDQMAILSKLGSERVASDYSTIIQSIPNEFALRIFYSAILGWM